MFRRILRLMSAMTRWELWVLSGLAILFTLSLLGLLRTFYVANTNLVASSGGTYIEGSVAALLPLNPWFTIQNDVNRDIVSLVFSGLLRYNPQTKQIEDDLATMAVSADGKVYTLTLKDNLFWHDSTSKDPHPVTVDDVLFTFQTVQQPGFPNALLQQNFRGVKIEKVGDRAVRFTLDRPYNFFPSNLTLGLLPKRAFDAIPVRKLDQALDFGFAPIGAGPYKFKSLTQTDLSSEVTLERFARPIPPDYHLDRIVFRVYSDYSSLLSDLRTLQGVRIVPRNVKGDPTIPKQFLTRTYTLPQYVALFFNLDHRALQDSKLRLGLQLGTDKQSIVDAIHEPLIVDTPLLEINVSNWRYHFDADAAQGALFASNWNLPEKIRLQHLLEENEANNLGPLRMSPLIYSQSGTVLTLTGSIKDLKLPAKINGFVLQPNTSASGTWIAQLPLVGTGALKMGENLLRLTDAKNKIIDSYYLFRAKDAEEFQRARVEQRLVQQFLGSKAATVPANQRINPQDLFVDHGMLRRRIASDPISVRRNDRGDPLELTLLTSSSPPQYAQLAKIIATEWATLGVQVKVDIPPTVQEFQDRMLRRDYDVLLFGQSLLDNLDSFPYWHSSGVQKVTGNAKDLRSDAYNLSQYASFKADTFLETIRRTTDEKERQTALQQLRSIIESDVPAIFLYSPLYTFAYRQDVHGVELGSLSLHSDRFLTLDSWYVKEERVFKDGKNWLSFFGWLGSLVRSGGSA